MDRLIANVHRQPVEWDDCVYRLTRAEWESVEHVAELKPMERLAGLEVRVLEDAGPDTVFVIDVKALRENTERLLFRQPDPIDPIAWKVRFG